MCSGTLPPSSVTQKSSFLCGKEEWEQEGTANFEFLFKWNVRWAMSELARMTVSGMVVKEGTNPALQSINLNLKNLGQIMQYL